MKIKNKFGLFEEYFPMPDAAHVGRPHRRHGEEAVSPGARVDHALIETKQWGDPPYNPGVNWQQLSGEMSPGVRDSNGISELPQIQQILY